MKATIFASYRNLDDAEKAMGAVLDHGLRPDEVSLIANENYVQVGPDEAELVSNLPPFSPEEYGRQRNEIEMNESTGTSYGHAAVSDLGQSPYHPEGNWGGPTGNFAGAEMAGGIESSDALSEYRGSGEPYETDDGAPAYKTRIRSEGEHLTAVEAQQAKRRAESGITTTTPDDASAGAVKGAALGLGVGVLAALASVFIPGIGLVVGGGALASAIAGTVGAAGAGAITGSIVGYLKDQGMPEEAITTYRDAFASGGVILAISMPADVRRENLEAILAKYGATNIDLYGEYAGP